MIRSMQEFDLENVLHIYSEGLQTKMATFETAIPSIEEWDKAHHKNLRFVAELDQKVVGWIALTQISSREVYRGVGEISIYISGSSRGMGIGTLLMEKMIQESENEGFWTLQSSVFKKNKSSIALHKKLEFRVVGTREKIAQLDGEWQDTIILERRSKFIV
ncbi:N-acetyltransferase family protein [Rummeliibacillus pycnus]|uniref:GNAT family N-acetyltransferase n=1 Tax=Rummeliibacillus pycnus TaxID=101070 RepID=UPI003D2C1A14